MCLQCISQCLVGGSVDTVKMGKRTQCSLDVSASLGLLQYWRVCSDINCGIRIVFIVYSYIIDC